MDKTLPTSVAIITGADPRFVPLFQQFARHQFGDIERFDLILHPEAEAAFFPEGVECQRYPKHLQGAVRDILETRAVHAWIRGTRCCVVIDCVEVEPEDPEFRRCCQHLAQELETISKWRCFTKFAAAFFTRRSHRLIQPQPAVHLMRPG